MRTKKFKELFECGIKPPTFPINQDKNCTEVSIEYIYFEFKLCVVTVPLYDICTYYICIITPIS